LLNGLFGGGGGMLLLPLLTWGGTLDGHRSFATSIGIILPICCVSAAVYLWRGEVSLLMALPYLLGGLVGGALGGRWFCKIPTRWLRRGFGLFLLYGGVRYLL
ncbi:MAG: TSUP family transporter, partial [Oscillospiraceae bacterium]